MFIKIAIGECDFKSINFRLFLTLYACNDLFQLNKTQYYRIHLTDAISLSPSLDYKNMTFFVFCEQLSENFEKLSKHLIK